MLKRQDSNINDNVRVGYKEGSSVPFRVTVKGNFDSKKETTIYLTQAEAEEVAKSILGTIEISKEVDDNGNK